MYDRVKAQFIVFVIAVTSPFAQLLGLSLACGGAVPHNAGHI
jgi:hypothetical protein